METNNLIDLVLEVIGEQTKWRDLVDTIDTVFKDRVDNPAYQLEQLRFIDQNTDPEIIDKTLRMSGFNLTSDFLKLNALKLRRMVYLLNTYYAETNGREDFDRFMELLLGRQVTVQNLYTQDYVSFYPQPFGPLNIDNGSWFLTTHVDIAVALEGLDSLLLNPGQGLEDKILQLFYQVAPLNLVVKNFFFTSEITGNVYLSGKVLLNPIRFVDLKEPLFVQSITIVGPTDVFEGQQIQYLVQVQYTNGTSVTEFASSWNVSNPGLVGINQTGLATFGQISVTTVVTLSVTHRGFSSNKSVTVSNQTQSNRVLIDILIDGNNQIFENSSSTYQARGIYSDGQIEHINPFWGIDVSPIATISQLGVVSVLGVESDTPINIFARVVRADNVTITTTRNIMIRNSNPRPTLVGIYVSGPTMVAKQTEGQTYVDYAAHAIYSNNTEQIVQPIWEVSTSAARIFNNGRMVLGTVDGPIACNVTATYSEEGLTSRAVYPVQLLPATIELLEVVIVGQFEMTENTSAQFLALGNWNINGQLVTSYVNPLWYANKFDMSNTGLLTVGLVSGDFVELVVRATVVNRGVVVEGSRLIYVRKKPRLPEFITVYGPAEVVEGSITQYSAFLTWNDQTVTPIEAEWSLISDNMTGLDIDVDGRLNVTEVLVGTIEVKAVVTVGPDTLESIITVVLIPKFSLVRQLIISGPNVVAEDGRITLVATAVFEDNTTQVVRPLWTIRSPNPLNQPEPDAYIVSSEGVVQGRALQVPSSKAIVGARFFSREAEFEITVIQKQEIAENVVETAWIIGPSTFYADYTPGYALMVKFVHLDSPVMLSSDWSINVGTSIATIDDNGYIRPARDTSATIVISTCACNGPEEICATLVVDMIAVDGPGPGPSPDHIEIVGQDAMIPNTSRQYICNMVWSDNTRTQVTPAWMITAGDVGITIGPNGLVTVPAATPNGTFVINANYSLNTLTYVANKQVLVQNAPSLPVYGLGPIAIDTDGEITTYLTNQMPGTSSGFQLTLNASTPSTYMYFAHRASLGIAQFIELITGFEGGWDGATWPSDGSIGNTVGPLSVQRTVNGITETWYLYRTDFGGIGEFTYTVNYV